MLSSRPATTVQQTKHLRDLVLRLSAGASARQHGVDPEVIPLPALIVRDIERRVYYPTCPAYIADPDATCGRECLDREIAFVQLESPPLPFPADPRQEMPDDDL